MIVNTWFDIEFAQALLLQPGKGQLIVKEPFFESIGHSLLILYDSMKNALSGTLDPNCRTIENTDLWAEQSLLAKRDKLLNWDSSKGGMFASIGLHDILEAHGRVQEMQYLHYTDCVKYSWEYFSNNGYLNSQYTYAIQRVFDVLKVEWPDSPVSPEINLFCLLCELAINPSDGYPYDINNMEQFTFNVQPGIRLLTAARYVSQHKHIIDKLVTPSADVYIDVSSEICKALGWHTPIEVAEKVVHIYNNISEHDKIENEYANNFVGNAGDAVNNYTARFIFARHAKIMEKKQSAPDYTCWPSYYLVGLRDFTKASDMISFMATHCAPFVAHGISKPIGYRPPFGTMIRDGCAKDILYYYYAMQIVADVHRQIVSRENGISFDYRWLDESKTSDFFRSKAEGFFERLAGRPLADFL